MSVEVFQRPDIRAEILESMQAAVSTGRRRGWLLTTDDPHHVVHVLADLGHRAGFLVARWRLAGGLVRIEAQREVPLHIGDRDPAVILRHIRDTAEPGMVIVLEDFVRFLAQSPEVLSHMLELFDPRPANGRAAPQVIVVVDEPAGVQHRPHLLHSLFKHRPFPLPTLPELAALVQEQFEGLDEQTAVQTASALRGLSLTNARRTLEDVLAGAMARVENNADGRRIPIDQIVRRLAREKERILTAETGLSLLDVVDAEEPIGLDAVRRYLEENRHRLLAPGRRRLRGLLFVGPPGIGKSMGAKAIGRWIGWPVAQLEMGRQMSPYVGGSENNIVRTTTGVESMAPVVLVIDEIEKALSGTASSNYSDAGTMARVYGHLLNWLNDCEEPVLVLATANRIDRLGEDGRTLTRRGRFDEIFFVDWPKERARMLILQREVARLGADFPGDDLFDLARHTEGFSGADLVSVVTDAASRARALAQPLAAFHIRKEIEAYRPRVQASQQDYDALRRWARANARPAWLEDE